MKDEVKKILEMLEQDKINAAQAAELLEAMQVFDEGKPVLPAESTRRQLKIKLLSAKGDKVDIKVPMTLVSAGLSIGRNFAGQAAKDNEALKEVDWDQLMVAVNQMLADGTSGEIVTVESAEGDTVHIWLE